MRKLCALVVMSVSVAAVHAGGIAEYKGRNYLVGELAGTIAQEYALRKESIKEYEIDSAIHDKKLYFMAQIVPVNAQEVLRRGYIQKGDTFLLSEDYPNTAVYTGQKKNIKNFLSKKDSSCYGIGYAAYGGAISIAELMTEEELENNPKIKKIE